MTHPVQKFCRKGSPDANPIFSGAAGARWSADTSRRRAVVFCILCNKIGRNVQHSSPQNSPPLGRVKFGARDFGGVSLKSMDIPFDPHHSHWTPAPGLEGPREFLCTLTRRPRAREKIKVATGPLGPSNFPIFSRARGRRGCAPPRRCSRKLVLWDLRFSGLPTSCPNSS